ncbi:hypothetical protein [Comamonas sp. JC664]|uniref:hypothetical protein n=1 Tax=Comamonas sp. JC664 TaxID=2801917 RepID=UPI001749E440|nr:hypothetical protein [Comamonas sp. JC664]MBL0694730.1 hypothetical protein [Comamonas sp. JC664]GHG94284.1 hypothetical protein GCM10012319_57080 [Comamonas sp. KCTC 72670]
MHSPVRCWTAWLLALVLAVVGCQPEGSGTGGTRQGFRPRESVVDFGRVLEGAQARRGVAVLATGRSGVTVVAAVDGPFAVVTPEVGVPGSGVADVEVVFTAGDGVAEGTLVLAGAGVTESVRLTGMGVRPSPCPERPCSTFHFDVASGACVETPLEEGAACTAESRCEVNGRCKAGTCVGEPRTCDDNNPCTVDACSPTRGCVTTQVACPAPWNPCEVGVCDRDKGCTSVNVDDFVPCGPVSCQTARLCLLGTCREMAPPEGFVCAPATACQDEGRCRAGACERPEPVELEPAFRQVLEGAPVSEDGGPVVLVEGDGVFTSVCGGDAGCQLVAYTGSGLLRYASAYPDGGARTLLAASDAGVVVRAADGLEGYAHRGSGERLWEATWGALGADAGTWAGGPGTGHVALTESGDVLAYVSWGAAVPDGGTAQMESARLVWLAGREDAGTVLGASQVEAWSGEARLVLGADGTAYVYTVDGRLRRVETEFSLTPLLDGGVPDGGASLAIANGVLLAGGSAFVRTDAGTPTTVDWDTGTGTRVPLTAPALVSSGGTMAYLFARACARTDGLPCTAEEERVVLRAVESGTGHTAWEVDALPHESLPGTVYEAALLQGDVVGVLADAESPDGHQSWLQFFSRGERVGMCPLPAQPRVVGAAFEGGALYVVLERDGVWTLESYGLGPEMQVSERGWPLRHGGPGGVRRELP